MHIRVEFKSDVLGNGVFWEGPAERIKEIHNLVARDTAEKVATDGAPRRCGMWHVSTFTPGE